VLCIRVDEVHHAGVGWHAEPVGAETVVVPEDLLPSGSTAVLSTPTTSTGVSS